MNPKDLVEDQDYFITYLQSNTVLRYTFVCFNEKQKDYSFRIAESSSIDSVNTKVSANIVNENVHETYDLGLIQLYKYYRKNLHDDKVRYTRKAMEKTVKIQELDEKFYDLRTKYTEEFI